MSKKPSITLGLIVKNEENNIEKALSTIYQHVDEICITDTGSTDGTVEKIKALPFANKIKISFCTPKTHPQAFFEDGAIYDFSFARNFNQSQATGDWYLWMDADDDFINAQNIPLLVEEAEKKKIDGFYFDYDYLLVDGKAVETHPKIQLYRNNGSFTWKGKIHEDALPDPSKVRSIAKTKSVLRRHTRGTTNDPKKNERNLRILLKELEDQKDNPDPRTLFYCARAFITNGAFEESVPLLEKYLELSGWQEEAYEAMFLLAESHGLLGNLEEARQVALKGIGLCPDRPELYFEMATVESMDNNYEKAREWCEVGFTRKVPTNAVTFFEHRYTTQPLIIYASTLLYLGKLEKALEVALRAVEKAPGDKRTTYLRDLILHTKKRKDVSKAYVDIVSFLKETGNDWKIRTLLGTVPTELDANPLIAKLKYDWLPPKIWPNKSVVILAFGAVEAWSPNNEKVGGIGGSEEAVINLSRGLQKRGYKVTVFTNTGIEDGVYDGVEWKMFTEFNGRDTFDTLILWRAPGLLDYNFIANTVLFDMHDVPGFGDWEGDRLNKVDRIMVKSNYHKSLLPGVPDDKISIVTNGINVSHFDKHEQRDPYRCIYSSAIDRGLDLLLDFWPKVRKEVPEATLHIYYGFKTFRELNRHNPERMRFADMIEKKMADMADIGVVYHGRVDHETLAKEYMKSSVWVYPTYFPEISCITAMKAQAAGAVPVCTDYAALDETVQHGTKVRGDVYVPEVREEFVEKLIATLKTGVKHADREEMAKWAKDLFTWERVAEQWDNIIKSIHHERKQHSEERNKRADDNSDVPKV